MDAYQTFVRDAADLKEDQETILVLRSLAPGRRKYFARNVVGVVVRTPSGDSHPLVVRSIVGNRLPGDRYVRIVRSLPQRVPGTPYKSAFEALQQAWGKLLGSAG